MNIQTQTQAIHPTTNHSGEHPSEHPSGTRRNPGITAVAREILTLISGPRLRQHLPEAWFEPVTCGSWRTSSGSIYRIRSCDRKLRLTRSAGADSALLDDPEGQWDIALLVNAGATHLLLVQLEDGEPVSWLLTSPIVS